MSRATGHSIIQRAPSASHAFAQFANRAGQGSAAALAWRLSGTKDHQGFAVGDTAVLGKRLGDCGQGCGHSCLKSAAPSSHRRDPLDMVQPVFGDRSSAQIADSQPYRRIGSIQRLDLDGKLAWGRRLLRECEQTRVVGQPHDRESIACRANLSNGVPAPHVQEAMAI